MSNTIKTLSDGDITRKALSILHNKLVFCKTINKQYDDRFARSGAKNGGSLLIRNPNQFTVRSGAVMDTQDVEENTQTLTVATQRGVDINFSSTELTLSMDDFADRILTPAMTRLAAEVDKIVITASYKDIYNIVYSTIGTAPVIADVQKARAKLSKGMAPMGDRICLMESLGMNTVVNDGKAFFNPVSEISKQYETGVMGYMSGFKFYESEMIVSHTCGTRTTAGQCDLSVVANEDTTLTTIMTSDETFVKGDIITVAGVYAVNPETKVAYSHLQQFALTTAFTCDATDALPVTPTLYKSGARQNVYCADWTENSAIVVVDTSGSNGVASTAYDQHMAYHKDAFTLVTADLEMPQGVDFAAREVYDGISLKIVRDYDIVNDKFPCRIDVLFGYKTIRPEWATRILGD